MVLQRVAADAVERRFPLEAHASNAAVGRLLGGTEQRS